MPMREKQPKAPRAVWDLDPNNEAHKRIFQEAKAEARVELKRLKKSGDDCFKGRLGELVSNAEYKWLVREMLFNPDVKAKWRAAGVHYEVIRGVDLIAKNRTNAKKSRPRGDSAEIASAVRGRPDGTYKEIAAAMESDGHVVKWNGFADRVSRAKRKLRAEQSEIDSVARRRRHVKKALRNSR